MEKDINIPLEQHEDDNHPADAVIVSGFPGVGKTTFFNNSGELTLLDSDSTNFSWSNKDKKERNPEWPKNYIDHILADQKKADMIFVSSHQETREALRNAGIRFVLVYPSLEMKSEYIQRYIARGSDEHFVALLEANYEQWIQELMTQKGCDHIVLQPGQYLSDVKNQIWSGN